MPQLDGLSATSLIRRFDAMTPIISMSGNMTPGDVKNYFEHGRSLTFCDANHLLTPFVLGMNDILTKPLTKDSIVGILNASRIQSTA